MNYTEAYRAGIRKVAALARTPAEVYKSAFLDDPQRYSMNRPKVMVAPQLPNNFDATQGGKATPGQIAQNSKQMYNLQPVTPPKPPQWQAPHPSQALAIQNKYQTPGTTAKLTAGNVTDAKGNGGTPKVGPLAPAKPAINPVVAAPATPAAPPQNSAGPVSPVPAIGTNTALGENAINPNAGQMSPSTYSNIPATPAPITATAPQPAPVTPPVQAGPPKVDNAAFRKAHGTNYDPNSVMDRNKWTAMQSKPLGGGLA